MGYRARGVALATAVVLSTSVGQAKEVRYPAAHPKVSMIVPNDWQVEETPLGLELQSPQKDSLVLAALSGADRKTIDGWAQRALSRMRSQGVVFAQSGPATPAAARAAATPGTPDPGKRNDADVSKPTGAAAFALMNGDRPYTFGDAPPTIAPPSIVVDDRAVAARAGDSDLPTVSDFVADVDVGVLKPAGHFLYTGGSLNGQPVDVELTLFPLGKDSRLLFEQQSGPIDARGVRIMRSLRDLTQ